MKCLDFLVCMIPRVGLTAIVRAPDTYVQRYSVATIVDNLLTISPRV